MAGQDGVEYAAEKKRGGSPAGGPPLTRPGVAGLGSTRPQSKAYAVSPWSSSSRPLTCTWALTLR